MGIGVDWMGLTLATGLSSGRETCRLKIKKKAELLQHRSTSLEAYLCQCVIFAWTAEIINVMKQIRKTPAGALLNKE